MSLLLIACALSLVIYLMLLGALWVQDHRGLANHSLRLYIGCMILWVCAELMEAHPASREHLLALQRLMVFAKTACPFFFLSFVHSFTGRTPGRGFYALAVASAAAVILGSLTNLVIADVEWALTGVITRLGWGYWPVVAVVSLNAVVALYLLGQALVHEPEQRKRGALAMVVIGGTFTLLMALSLDVFLPYFNPSFDWSEFSCCISTIFCGVVWVAMIRHDFLSSTLEQVAEDLFARSGEGIALVDAEQMVRRINPAAASLLGLPTIGGPWAAEVVLPGYKPKATFAQRVIQLETTGQKRMLSLSQSTHEGVIAGYATVLVYRDISEDQRIHRRLEEERITLEKEVAHRTAELERTREREALGAVASSVIHDFNNQLFPIISIAELVREDLPEEHPARLDIDEMIRAANQAAEVGRQLLGFTRRVETRKGLVDLSVLIQEVHQFLKSSAKKNVSLSCVIEAEPACVIGTAAQFRHAIINIATNALEAIDPKGGSVELLLWRSDPSLVTQRSKRNSKFSSVRVSNVSSFVVTVSDTGPGIPEERQPLVCQPFFTTKGGLGRSGLGLTVALHIAEQHGGALEISSNPEKGTKVSLVLPSLARPSWLTEVQESPHLFGRERILVCTPRESFAADLPHVLAPLGYQLVIVDSEAKAHRVMRSEPAY
ncbi:MAG: ATP-binding protein [Myxococcota bacterium]|nr:ATP-binding protein [Myxococcota bacterium]